MINNQDIVFLKKSITLSNNSPDPRTKIGAILINCGGLIIGEGYNHYINGVVPDKNKKKILHAERAAIYDAIKKHNHIINSTLYCYWVGCIECCLSIAGVGIKRVVTHKISLDKNTKWLDSIELGHEILHESGIQFDVYDGVLKERIFKGGEYRWI